VWVSSWNIQCGIATYSRYLLNSYDDAIEDVTVLCDARTEDLLVPDAPTARIAWQWGDPGVAERLASEIGKTDARVVVIQYQPGLISWDHLPLLFASEHLRGRDVVLELHTVQEMVGRPDRDAILQSFRGLRRILVHNAREVDLLKGYGVVDNVALFPHGTLQPQVPRVPARDLPVNAAPRIGAYGFIFPHKGFGALVEAFAEIKKCWTGATLRMVTAQYPGESSAAEVRRCQDIAKSLGITDAIEWQTDFLPDERSLSLLAPCDLLVLPYQYTAESASGAARVAMASRVPILVTPVAIFDEMGDSMLRSEGTDAKAIAAGIDLALRDRGLRQRTVDNADAWLDAHSWARMGKRLSGMIRGLVTNKR
jgi:glycosyltransferase involved in cell wall biosynthesis